MFSFETDTQGAMINSGSTAFTGLMKSNSSTYCGAGALAINALFSGASGPSTKGEVLLNLPGAPVDLTGKTITIRFAADPGCSSDLDLSLVLNTQAGPMYFTQTFPIQGVTNNWTTAAVIVPAGGGASTALALSLQVFSSTGYQGKIYIDEIDIGTTGTGGATGSGGTGGLAGRGGATGTAGATGSGGTAATGGNCVDNIKRMGYAYTAAMPCSACVEMGTSREAACKAMIDCLDAASCTSSSSNCWLTCRNANGISGPTESCVNALVNAACMPGANSCSLGGVLDCTSTGALRLTPDGQVTDFGAADWNSSTFKWCDVHGLDGSLYSYAGAGSTATAAVDTTAGNLKFNFTAAAGQYAGGGISFDSCVDASSFNALQFTAAITAGSLSGCAWQVQLETQDERPSTQTSPSGGTCNSTTTTCNQYPAYAITAAPPSSPAAPMTFSAPFTGFTNPLGTTIRTQIVGLQWQVYSSQGTGTCTAELRIDDVKFVSQ
jgi:hypothetical protein